MKLAASALHFVGRPFKNLVNAMKASDVRRWELVDEASIRLDARRVKILQDLRLAYGFEYSVHAPFADVNIASLNPFVRCVVLKRLSRSLELAGKLECSVWVVHPGGSSGLSEFYRGEDRRLNLESVRLLAEKAADSGVTLCIENVPEPFQFFLKRPAEIREFFDVLALDGVKLSFDVGHAHTVAPIEEFLDKLADVIGHLHLHDNDGSLDRHLPIGNGTVNWKAVFGWIKKSGYNGFIVVETFSDPVPEVRKLASMLGEVENTLLSWQGSRCDSGGRNLCSMPEVEVFQHSLMS